MKRLNERTTELLIRLWERYQIHAEAAKRKQPIVSEFAEMMIDAEFDEFWMLTQM